MSSSFPYRMMDANLNRTAEGLRVIEDVLRFDLEAKDLCELTRALRHRLRESFQELYPRLLKERKVESDPGVKISREQPLDSKKNRHDLLLANLKRVQEGLRVLEESAHVLSDRSLAKEIESLRFQSYNLESLLTPYLSTSESDQFISEKTKRILPAGLYALTSEPHSLGRSNIMVAEEILQAGVKTLQYREKNKKQKQMYEECLVLRELTRNYGALFIVNDSIEIAIAVGADGVHIGQDDLPIQVVRDLVGPSMIIGVSTHSPEQAQAAISGGADYIGVGPLYATRTKTDVCDPVGIDYLRYIIANTKIPFVAIGGIKEHNLPEVVRAGAKTIALVTEIVGSPDIGKKIKELHKVIAENLPSK